jgi:alpha-N-acetylglucosamine transferase
MANSDSGKAWVTLLTKTSYLQGCLVLNHSLHSVKSKYPLVVFATPTLPEEARVILNKKGIRVRDIKYIDPPKDGKQLDEHDQRFADTWTKLRCFEMTEYDVSSILDRCSERAIRTDAKVALAGECSESSCWTVT